MRTILGKTVTSVSLYKKAYKNDEIGGNIYLQGGQAIRIDGNRFTFLRSATQKGAILKGTAAYRRIKRMIAVFLRNYRKNGAFNCGADYWQASVRISLNKFKIHRMEQFKNKIAAI